MLLFLYHNIAATAGGRTDAEPSNIILLGELKKINEALSKVHKRLKNTEDILSDMQSELNSLSAKKRSKSVVASKEVRVSTYIVATVAS